MSWGVRRIEEEPSGQGVGGQRRPTMTVGEWLEAVSVPPRTSREAMPAGRPPVDAAPLESLDRKLEELNRRLRHLSDRADPDRDRHDRTSRRSRRDAPDRDFEARDGNGRADTDPAMSRSGRRDGGRNPINERLDQIDRRLQAISEAPRQPATQAATGTESDADRLHRGLRDIERLQAAFAETLATRARTADHDAEAMHQRDRRDAASPVAHMITRLEEEVRGLRQSVEKRLEPTEPTFDERDIHDMRRMLERLTEAGATRQESEYVGRLLDEMTRLRDLVIETGAKVASVPPARAAQESRLADMVERLAAVATSAQEKTSDDMRSLERRLGDVADRMGELEGNGASQKDIAELQRAMNAIAAKLDRPVPQPKPVIPAALLDLDIRIEKLGEKLERIEPNPATARQMASLESEISALRLDFAQSPAARAPDRFDDQLRSLGERIDRLAVLSRGGDRLADQVSAIGERIDRLAANGQGTDRIEQQIQAMGERIERMSSIAQTGSLGAARLETFESRIGEIVSLLDRMSAPQASLERNIGTLHGEVSSLRRDIASIRPAERNPELEDLLRSLSQRLETAAREQQDPRLIARIEERLARLTEMLGEQRKPVDLGAVEAKLGNLEALLVDHRGDTLEAASAAARDAVKEFAALAAESRASDAGVQALEGELRQVQAATRTTEARTSDALQSVHDALTTIVGRLGAIERSAREPVERMHAEAPAQSLPRTPHAAADAPTQQVRPEPMVTSDTRPPAPRGPAPVPTVRTVEPPATPPPQLEDTRPLEPGSGKPMPGRVPAGSGAAAPAGPEASGNRRNDFIAAARRAALAASQPGPGAPPPVQADAGRPGAPFTPPEPAAPKSKSLFKSLFKGKQKVLIIAGVGIAGVALVTPLATSALVRMAAVAPTARLAVATTKPASPPGGTPVAAADTKSVDATAASTEALALAPPTGPASTFTRAGTNEEATRQAALAAALKQVAAAQGVAPDGKSMLATGSVHPPTGGDATRQPMPPAIDLATPPPAEATKPATGEARSPMPPEKIGSLALRTAAANGDPKAQFEVGMRYSEGKVVPTDMREAVAWFERAAARHFAPAAYRLGSSYEKGLGVDRSTTEAKRWYREAAEAGNVRAMHNLGVLYANDRDMPSAMPWFQKAADAGLKDSQFNLGIIFALGSGVKQDIAVSYKWFALAAQQGDQEAAKKRDDVATHLDHAMLASAKMAVSTWRPTQVAREANEETAVWSEPATAAAAPPRTAVATPPASGFNKIMEAQAALQGKGLYSGKIDGEMTAETRAAIRAFQKKSGLRQTGQVDSAFLNAVNARQM